MGFRRSRVALDYAGRGIWINELQLGVIATPMIDTDPDAVKQIAAVIPSRRVGPPVDPAEAICFLLSPAASYITGTHFAVDPVAFWPEAWDDANQCILGSK